MKGVTLSLAVLVWAAGCASTRYEEYGPPVEEPIELPFPPADASEFPATGEAPETRPARLKAMLTEQQKGLLEEVADLNQRIKELEAARLRPVLMPIGTA